MKKSISVLLVISLLACQCGCGGQASVTESTAESELYVTEPLLPVEATELPETTAPAGTTTPPTEPEPTYVPVEESWFDDALFIGESRTVGLQQVARLGGADYFCAGSMTVFTVQEWQCIDQDFPYLRLHELLKQNTYGKVYIHLGLNECAGDLDMFAEKYQELIDLIRANQPDAVIILQSIMSINRAKASTPPFSLERVIAVNQRIEELAQEQGLFFQDTNTWLTDEEGYMLDDLSGDGCHLHGFAYIQWSEYILEQAGWLGIS